VRVAYSRLCRVRPASPRLLIDVGFDWHLHDSVGFDWLLHDSSSGASGISTTPCGVPVASPVEILHDTTPLYHTVSFVPPPSTRRRPKLRPYISQCLKLLRRNVHLNDLRQLSFLKNLFEDVLDDSLRRRANSSAEITYFLARPPQPLSPRLSDEDLLKLSDLWLKAWLSRQFPSPASVFQQIVFFFK